MTARLVLTTDGTDSIYSAKFEDDLQKSFAALMDRFDWTGGTVTVKLSYTQDTAYALSSAPGALIKVGTSGSLSVEENAPLQAILSGTGAGTGILLVSDPYIQNVYRAGGPWAWDIGHSTLHELLHILGNDYSQYDRYSRTVTGTETTYDAHVTFDSAGNPFFIGANAMAVYGGPVPLDPSIDHSNFSMLTPSNVNHVGSVMDYNQDGDGTDEPWKWSSLTLTRLDFAMMKDDGVPALTDNERDEHFFTRACDVLLHHQVTASAIEAWAKILEGNGGDLAGTAAQFLGLLGIQSMTGAQLVEAANADAERLKLAQHPEMYSHTMEQEIARIYRLSTGQGITSADYARALDAALGSPITAVTLQTKVAPIFLSGAVSAASFSHDVDHKAAVEHILRNGGIVGWDSFPAATKVALLTMPVPDLVVALADNATCVQNEILHSSSFMGPEPGTLPAIALNVPRPAGV
jgi:hypothetical protein